MPKPDAGNSPQIAPLPAYRQIGIHRDLAQYRHQLQIA